MTRAPRLARLAAASVALTAASAALTTAPASADVLTLFVEATGGGVAGQGTSGDQVIKDSAFFAKAPHIDYGALVGAELLFLDLWIQHHQFTDGSRVATWTQFGLGVHLQFDFNGKQNHQGGFFEVGGGGWFGLGTGQQIMPPLDNAQISDKALIVEGRLGLGSHLSNVFDIGVEVPGSWGYFFKNGAAVNDSSNHYQSVQIEGLVFLRANLRLL
jgi:hypothetical protein